MPAARFHPDAYDEAEEEALWYELRHEGLGEDFLSELDRAVNLISESPAAWPRWPGLEPSGIRRFLLARFPFALAYEVLEGEVVIYAVAHLSRKPGYWKHRTER